MKMKAEHGQALTEYLISLAAVTILALAGVQILLHALNAQWDSLTFWLILPSP